MNSNQILTCSTCNKTFQPKFVYRGKSPKCYDCRNNIYSPTTIKVAYNNCYGGFTVSNKGENLYCKYSNGNPAPDTSRDFDRTDPILIRVIEELGKEVSGSCSNLCIETIPIEFKDYFEIDEYDGSESVNYSSLSVFKKDFANMNISEMSPEECKSFLMRLKDLDNLAKSHRNECD
jgi:hypothetical protein